MATGPGSKREHGYTYPTTPTEPRTLNPHIGGHPYTDAHHEGIYS